MALLSASAVACGSDDDEEPGVQPTLCDDVVCGENATCDLDDGFCKCGDGNDAVVCLERQRCEPEPSPTCVSDLCDFVVCQRGQACDPTDGDCKCGNVACADNEICVEGACQAGNLCEGVECGDETCDPTDGICKCGTGDSAALCSFGQVCEAGGCQDDPCAGVNCGEGTVCNPTDGLCHCGGVDGTICSQGQACVDDGTGAFACNGPDICAGNTCTGGTVCDPLRLTDEGNVACRCGGVGPTNPVCGPDQSCDLATGRCVGGDQCRGVSCTGGLSCDPEDGICKCGGLNGRVCGAAEVCVELDGEASCSQSCNPLDQSTCPTGFACYVDSTQADAGAFCAPVSSNAPGDDSPCDAANDCATGLHCLKTGTSFRCRPYCDPALGRAACASQRSCSDDVDGLPAGVGVCVVQG